MSISQRQGSMPGSPPSPARSDSGTVPSCSTFARQVRGQAPPIFPQASLKPDLPNSIRITRSSPTAVALELNGLRQSWQGQSADIDLRG